MIGEKIWHALFCRSVLNSLICLSYLPGLHFDNIGTRNNGANESYLTAIPGLWFGCLDTRHWTYNVLRHFSGFKLRQSPLVTSIWAPRYQLTNNSFSHPYLLINIVLFAYTSGCAWIFGYVSRTLGWKLDIDVTFALIFTTCHKIPTAAIALQKVCAVEETIKIDCK